MATTTLTPIDSWRATGTDSEWTNDYNIWSGTPSQGGNYRTKIAFSTAGLLISKSEKFVVAIKVNNSSYPAGCSGVLTELDISDPGDVQNNNATGPSDELSAAAIATSVACNEDGSAFSSGWVGEDTIFYFVFDSTQLKADKTYYVYVIRSSSGSSWVQAYKSGVSATLTYSSYTACTAPTQFTASPSVFEDDLTLQWSGATGGMNNRITGYEIQYATSEDGITWSGWTAWKTVTGTSATDTPGINRGQYRKYRIRTLGSAGSAYYSGWVSSNAAQKDNEPYVYIPNDSLDPERYLSCIYDETIDPEQPFGKYMPFVFDGTAWQRYS